MTKIVFIIFLITIALFFPIAFRKSMKQKKGIKSEYIYFLLLLSLFLLIAFPAKKIIIPLLLLGSIIIFLSLMLRRK